MDNVSWGYIGSKVQRETPQNIINNNSGKRWSAREGKERGREAMYDMCMCANFYQYHKKSMNLQRLLSALVLGAGLGLVGLIFRLTGVEQG